MDWLEEELKSALSRQTPAPGFGARVTAAARRGPSLPGRRWLALAASIMVLIGAGEAYRWHQGVEAKQQVLQAVRIAAVKLNRIQTHVREVPQ
jgi:hypothetical protein